MLSEDVLIIGVLLFVALWFILRAICFKSCLVVVCSCVFQSFFAWRLPRLGKRELIVVLFVCSICACLALSVFSSSSCQE